MACASARAAPWHLSPTHYQEDVPESLFVFAVRLGERGTLAASAASTPDCSAATNSVLGLRRALPDGAGARECSRQSLGPVSRHESSHAPARQRPMRRADARASRHPAPVTTTRMKHTAAATLERRFSSSSVSFTRQLRAGRRRVAARCRHQDKCSVARALPGIRGNFECSAYVRCSGVCTTRGDHLAATSLTARRSR